MQRAFLLAVVFALLSLLLFVQVDGNEAWLRVAFDRSLVLILAVVAVLLCVILRRVDRPGRDGRCYVVAFMLAVVVGVAIEHLQSLNDRPASLFDLGSNAAGAATGISLLALHERAGRRGRIGRAVWWVLGGAAPGRARPAHPAWCQPRPRVAGHVAKSRLSPLP